MYFKKFFNWNWVKKFWVPRLKTKKILDHISEGNLNDALSIASNWVNSIEPSNTAESNEKLQFGKKLEALKSSIEDLQTWVTDELEPTIIKHKVKKRHYETSKLPIIADVSLDKRYEILKELYTEINSNYRNLADIRFKLLGFVPAISALAWIQLTKEVPPTDTVNDLTGLIISILALRITYGIRLYDKRNDELYNDLISRGRRLEDELKIHTGLFKGRLKANQRHLWKEVTHGRALALIYSSVYVGWSLFISWYALKLFVSLLYY